MLLLNVFHSHFDNLSYMVVGKGIENNLSFLSELHQLVVFKHPQLMGNRRLTKAKQLRHVVYAQLRLKEGIKYSYSCSISENLKKLRQIV